LSASPSPALALVRTTNRYAGRSGSTLVAAIQDDWLKADKRP
jgi:hypothetical protein